MINWAPVDFPHLKLFRDIAQTGSMSRGAALNNISQSAASQHVQELERNLDAELIDRSSRPLRLTEAGRLYADLCRDVLRRREEFESALEQLRTGVVGSVRVAAIFSVGLVEMSRIEEEFAQRWPEARIEVQYVRPERVYEAVRHDEVDLGLVSYPHPAKDIAVIPWREEEMMVAAAPAHPVSKLSRVAAADLDGMEFIGFDKDLPIRREVDRFLRDRGAEVDIRIELDSIPMIKEALAIGHAVSILPERMLRAEVAAGSLVCIPLEAPGLIRPLGIIHLKKKRFSRAATAFLSLLRQPQAVEDAETELARVP
ncbi:MAG: LysR family transcriptional regulator [Bryobacterales bacterium]|nr:LysR family transcriptional regulator [Bryobacterales bacterium]